MRRWLWCLTVLFAFTGALPVSGQEASVNDFKTFKESVENYLLRHAAASKQDMKARNEMYVKQQAEMDDLSTAVRAVLAKMTALEKKIAASEAENTELKQTIATLQTELAAERNARIKADQKVVSDVTEVIGKVVRKTTGPGPKRVVTGTRYKVVRGDTLSAIAQAFGAKVSAIKEANDLKNDMIRPGQELIIPGGQQ